jgi:hypothetical protein
MSSTTQSGIVISGAQHEASSRLKVKNSYITLWQRHDSLNDTGRAVIHFVIGAI